MKLTLHTEIDNQPLTHTISASETPLVLGRSRKSGLVLNVPSVSRQHAEIETKQDGFFLRNINTSGNRTWVNSIQLTEGQRAPLNDGDEIELGEVRLTVELSTMTEVAELKATDPTPKLIENLIGHKLGKYEILEEVGKGGMARVYRAQHRPIGGN